MPYVTNKGFIDLHTKFAQQNATIARLQEQNKKLREALEYLLDCSPCQNGCDPDDMTCASNKSRAALKETE